MIDMKGAMEPLTAIMITGVLIGVVGSVYFWGLPLIQKHEDLSILRNSEGFIINLNNKIKNIANQGGRDKIEITIPGSILHFDGEEIALEIETRGTSYAEGALVPLGTNDCTMLEGTWGIHSSGVLCVLSECISKTEGRCEKYLTSYKLKYITLNTKGITSYRIEFISPEKILYGVEKNSIVIENKGSQEKDIDGRNLISTLIEINII